MKFLPNGREYLRADESDHSKGWTWNDGGDRRTPCDAETCAILDRVMELYERLGRTPEERDAEAKDKPNG